MRKLLILILSGVILINLVACIKSSSLTDASKTDLQILSNDNNTFALELYQTLKEENTGNIFYSPYSISSALAMTYAGARGETEKQMADTMHFTLSQDMLHPSFHDLSLELASRGNGMASQDKKGFILRNVNALWGQKGYEFQPAFLDVLDKNYGAGMRTLDFARETEKSRITINDWVSEQTENRIDGLIGTLSPSTRLILTNAIYFKADWLNQFSKTSTSDGEFNLLVNGKVIVPMMRQTENFDYTDGTGYQAIELPYQGAELSMVILLPKPGRFESFENSLNYSQLQKIINNLKGREVTLTMPKFGYTSDFQLSPVLAQMGMPTAFSGSADFSGITPKNELWIDEVIHKAFVAVDENGTEAAAATAIIMCGAAPNQPKPVEFTMDRPFIFLIRDIETNTILFMGRVLNPLED